MKHTKETIKTLLQTNDKALVRGLMVIYGLQTQSEQAAGATREDNGVGFSGVHSEFLSSLASQVAKGRTLSPKQMSALRKTMVRYAGQLAKVANGKIANPLPKKAPKAVVVVPPEELQRMAERRAAIEAIDKRDREHFATVKHISPMQW